MHQKPFMAYLNRFSIKACLLFLGIFFLSSCATLSDPETTQTYHTDMVGYADGTHSLQQTIQTRQKRIDGIFLWLQSTPDSNSQDGKITFELYNPPEASSPWATTSIKPSTYRPDQPVLIIFKPVANTSSGSYKLVITARDCTLQVFGRAEDAYAQGTASQDDAILPADIAFRVKYKYDVQALWEDFISIFPQSWLIVITFLFFIAPGSLLLSKLKVDQFFNPAERIGLVVAINIALPVCIMEWSSLFDFKWTKGAVWCVYVGVVIIYIFLRMKAIQQAVKQNLLLQDPSTSWLMQLALWFRKNRFLIALILIFIITLTVRLIMVRDLAAPPWVDSVHHALLTRIIMEQGKFPETYSPYIVADNARYHPGYHVMLAVFQWLSGLEMQTGMLLFGQLLNAFMVFGVFLFAITFTGNSKTGLFAALIVALFTPMPAYYTSWGRYTQLAGLVILPAAFALINFILSPEFNSLANRNHRISIIFLASLLCASLFITHYRVIIFLALLLFALWIMRGTRSIKNRLFRKTIIGDLFLILSVVVIAVVLSSPWLPGALAEFIVPRIESTLKGDSAFAGHSWAYLTAGLGTWTCYLAIAGVLFGIFKRKNFTWVLILWIVFLFLMANMNMLKLPMSGYINNTSVEIALFLPIAVFGADFLVFVINLVGRVFSGKWNYFYNGILFIGIIIISVFGAQKLIPILNSDTVLLHHADIPAIHWIENNIPAEETISINPFAWGYGLFTGADGGFWITPLSGRKTMPPPLLYGFDTQGEIAKYITQTSKEILLKGGDPVALSHLLVSENIRYVYLGARGGVFSHQKLMESDLYELIYNENGIWIFELVE